MNKKTRETMFSSANSEYGTPRSLYQPLDQGFEFNLDGAASHENHKTPWYFTQDGLWVRNFTTPYRKSELDGLCGDWGGPPFFGAPSRVWLNPPYGRGITELWVRKCYRESHNEGVELIVALLPARTDTIWFHSWVLPVADVWLIQGRIHFDGAPSSAPFPSMLAVYGGHKGAIRTTDLSAESLASIGTFYR